MPGRWQRLFCVAPAVFPWYLLWLLPFLTSASTLPIIVWTVSIIPTYVHMALARTGAPVGCVPGWVMLLEYGCVAIAAAIIVCAGFMRQTARASGAYPRTYVG